MDKSKAFLEMVVKAMVADSSAVKIESRTDDMGVLLTLTVAQPDMGRIIGKEGATAKALRTLLRVVGMQDDARVNLKIVEPEGSAHYSRRDSNASDRERFGV